MFDHPLIRADIVPIFHLPGREVEPYSLSPWQPGEFPELPPLLSVLRGDFLCLPFTGLPDGPPHGDTANGMWTRMDSDDRSLKLLIDAADTGARVVRTLSTREGHHAVYLESEIANLDGDFSYGTHPILDLSGVATEGGRVTTSAFRWASIYPGLFSDPAAGECQALADGKEFTDLREVPLAAGGTTDLTRYPARPGNDDLVMMAHEPATSDQPFAWSAVVLDGYIWFSLKNPADFPGTLFWLSNGGRSASPWNSHHLGRIGIEDVCSHFCDGVGKSRQDLLAGHGVPTTRRFKHNETVTLRNIHAVAALPHSFGEITEILPAGDRSVRLVDDAGSAVIVPLDWKFLA